MNRPTPAPAAGARFGSLTFICVAPSKGRGAEWLVRCDCGETKSLKARNVNSGHAASCGCRRGGVTRHGMADTPIHNIWSSMIARCTNPRDSGWKHYGGRGITVCQRWRTFENFFADMGERPSDKHSLDRINNDGNYEPGNVRWATDAEQQRNTSRTRRVTLHGRTMCVKDWARELGISSAVVYTRMHKGWSAERALTTPLMRRGVA